MAIAYVRSVYSADGGASSFNISLTAAADDFVIILTRPGNAEIKVLTGVTDDKAGGSNTYSQFFNLGLSGHRWCCYWTKSAGNITAVTLTFDGNTTTNWTTMGMVFTGLAASPADIYTTESFTTTTTGIEIGPTSGSSAVANSLVIGGVQGTSSGGDRLYSFSDLTILRTSLNTAFGYKTVSSTGTQKADATWNTNASETGDGVVAVFSELVSVTPLSVSVFELNAYSTF